MQTQKISLKKKYVHTSAWRGYEQPVNAVCGANDTGDSSDSPCSTSTCLKELGLAKKILKANKIPFRSSVCCTSNIFCISRYLVVLPDDMVKAAELIKPLHDQTRLLYTCYTDSVSQKTSPN